MKQVVQNYRTGQLELAEVPSPGCGAGSLLVRTAASAVSVGTERSIIELGRKSLLGKARQRPDLVRRFVEKAKNEGLGKTIQETMGRLDTPIPLGYSSAGTVIQIGRDVHRFSPGERVACMGAGYASHAEYVTVPQALCATIPDGVGYESAAFGTVGTIALHGVRSGRISFGETVAVIGLGLLGLIAVQLLRAYGCRPIGFDIDPDKCRIAAAFGVDMIFSDRSALVAAASQATDGHGVDAVVVTAATSSAAPVTLGVELLRPRGRLVVVGVADIHPDRQELWHKEIEVLVSRAGGPGTLEPDFENRGIDYPIQYVRWTEARNLAEILRLMQDGRLDIGGLITHRFSITDAERAYGELLGKTQTACIGVVFEYPRAQGADPGPRTLTIREPRTKSVAAVGAGPDPCSVAVIGAGLFAKALLLPALQRMAGTVRLRTLCTTRGVTAQHAARRFGFEQATTDVQEILEDPQIGSVFVLSPHDTHARLVISALQAGKHVFVEKPLCIDATELDAIADVVRGLQTRLHVQVGFNRRCSPHLVRVAEHFSGRRDPMVINYRVNAGFLPGSHWVHDAEQGGSRVIGEVCHFVDTCEYLIGSPTVEVVARRVSGNNTTCLNSDNLAVALTTRDGSLANILYTAVGDRALPRERLEVFAEQKAAVVDDLRTSWLYARGRSHRFGGRGQSAGYREELDGFFRAAANSDGRVDVEDLERATLVTFKINESLQSGTGVEVRG